MFGAKVMALAAALVALSATTADAHVCYSPWHHSSVTSDVVGKDLAQIKQYFTAFRSYHASFSGVNVIDAAASAGIKVAVGIQMGDKSGIAGEITAACDGAKRNPSSVSAIYVGNENLQNGNFGTYSAAELVDYINQVKSCTSGLNIKVGSVQRINEWLGASGAADLAAASDVIGVNIYPFFTSGTQTPIEKLKAQWAQMTAKYSESKITLTETGWPRQGETTDGNVPSQATTQSFLNDFLTWSKSHSEAYFFMMYDATVSYSGSEYEKYFGLANTDGVLQVTIPTTDGSGSSTTTTAPSTDSPAATTAAPAATTAAPAATTAAPAATTAAPAATTAAPAVTTAAPAATTAAPAATTAAPAATPGVAQITPTANDSDSDADSDSDSSDGDATPAPVAASNTGSKKKTSCE